MKLAAKPGCEVPSVLEPLRKGSNGGASETADSLSLSAFRVLQVLANCALQQVAHILGVEMRVLQPNARVSTATGAEPEELFGSIERTPLASASLAQVHRATARHTGAPLAVKVRRVPKEQACLIRFSHLFTHLSLTSLACYAKTTHAPAA
eukprot:6211292-Pleurochrysis_carterae.AAC.2